MVGVRRIDLENAVDVRVAVGDAKDAALGFAMKRFQRRGRAQGPFALPRGRKADPPDAVAIVESRHSQARAVRAGKLASQFHIERIAGHSGFENKIMRVVLRNRRSGGDCTSRSHP